MTTERRYIGNGDTIAEWISTLSHDLNDDGVGLGLIVGDGRRGFGLRDVDLRDFIRRSLHAVIAFGGRIVKEGPKGWELDDSYGTAPDDIVENIIRAWQAAGEPEPEWGQWWFVLPRDLRNRRG